MIVLPFAAIGPLVPGGLPVAAAAVGVFALMVVFDAVQAGRGLRGVRLVLPALVRLQKDRPGRVEVVIRRTRSPRQLFRIGVVMAESILPEEEEYAVSAVAGLTDAKLEWRCTPRERGKFLIREAVAEVASPLGFWLGRMRQETACELRVYPNLFAERRQVAALFLRRGRAGAHTQRQAGQGREFEKLRNYSSATLSTTPLEGLGEAARSCLQSLSGGALARSLRHYRCVAACGASATRTPASWRP